MMALLGLYMLTLDQEWSPEIYVAATKREQANILFNSVKAQIGYSKNKKLIKKLKVDFKRDIINCHADKQGTFKSLSRDSKSFDGLNVHCALVDEIHAHPNSEIWDVINSGAAKREQSLMVAITTAGTSFTGFGYSYSSYIKTLLQHSHDHNQSTDDAVFGAIWTVDKGDDLYSPQTWQKANPGWFSSVNKETIRDNIERTRLWVETKAETFTKHLCVWYRSNDVWLEPEYINECNQLTLDESDFKNDDCIIGVDLAYAEDMLAYAKVYQRYEDDGKIHFYVFPKYYTPEKKIKSGDNKKYERWVSEGLLISDHGDIIDFDNIQRELEKEYDKGNVLGFCFDRWNSTQMSQSLQNKYGLGAVHYAQQNMSGLNEASKYFKLLIIENRIHFKNDIFVWNCLNSYVKYSSTGTLTRFSHR